MASNNNTYNPSEMMQLFSAFQKSRILLTAYEIDIFTIINDKKLTVNDIAKEIKTETKATERLLNALCGLGFLNKENELFSNTDFSNDFLVKGKPSYMLGIQHLVHLWDTWSNMTYTIKNGEPPHVKEINDRGDVWLRAFINAMHGRGRQRAVSVAPLIDFENVKTMLDVGGGSGVFSSTFVSQNPKLSSTIFDLRNVIPITQEFIEQSGYADRIKTLVGDYREDGFGGKYDMIFLSAIIHSNSYHVNNNLIRKCVDSLNSKGQIVILDYVMNNDRTLPVSGAIFALNMLVGTEDGDTYTRSEISEWLNNAGIYNIEIKAAQEGNSLVIGHKE
jgi:2-polyprenyl-3-methyl-5-hydroxy-6-metoxy-1,4-benzoquinol methylase